MNSILVFFVAALALANAGIISPIRLVAPAVVPAVAANSAAVLGPDGGKVLTSSVVAGGIPVVQPAVIGAPLRGIVGVGHLGLGGPVVASSLVGRTILI